MESIATLGTIEGPSSNIWIDLCELYNAYDDTDKEDYDGLLDIKRNCDNITISCNKHHGSWKASLVGSSNSDDDVMANCGAGKILDPE